MRQTPEQFIEHLAKIDEDFGGIEIYPMHCDENQNVLTIRLESSEYGEPDITQEQINEIIAPLNVGPEAVKVYASSEPMYLAYEDHEVALLMQIKVPTPENEVGEPPRVKVEPVFEGVHTEPFTVDSGEMADISVNKGMDYKARVTVE